MNSIKKIALLSLVLLAFTGEAFSQLGLYISPTLYRPADDNTFANADIRIAADAGLRYSIPMSEDFRLQIGLISTKRISDIDFDFSQAKIKQDFLNISLSVDYSKLMNEKTSFVLGAGIFGNTPYQHNVVFPLTSEVPDNFQTEYGFGSYYKFGFLANMGLRKQISKRSAAFIMLSTHYELDGLSLNKNKAPGATYYSTFMELGYEFSLRK